MLKETLAYQDSKVHLVSLVLRVLMVAQVHQVSQVPQVDQESPVDQEDLDCPEKRVRQVGTGSQDQLESKENPVFLVMVVLVLVGFQGCQVLRETQVFLVHPAVLVSQDPKGTLASPVPLVLQVTAALLDLKDRLCRVLKDSKDPLDHPEEQVHPAHRVPEDPQEVVALRERREFLALPASLASPDRREKVVFQDSRVPLVFLVLLALKEMSVCLACPDSLDQRETQDFPVAAAFLEIPEKLDRLVLLVIPASLRLPSW